MSQRRDIVEKQIHEKESFGARLIESNGSRVPIHSTSTKSYLVQRRTPDNDTVSDFRNRVKKETGKDCVIPYPNSEKLAHGNTKIGTVREAWRKADANSKKKIANNSPKKSKDKPPSSPSA